MTQTEPVVVRQFFSTIEAELALGALHAAGIEAMVSADDCGGMRPHLQMGRVSLLVSRTTWRRPRASSTSRPSRCRSRN